MSTIARALGYEELNSVVAMRQRLPGARTLANSEEAPFVIEISDLDHLQNADRKSPREATTANKRKLDWSLRVVLGPEVLHLSDQGYSPRTCGIRVLFLR
jgi:hypothetical protein